MMLASILLAALALNPGSGLRLVNTSDVAADAVVRCADSARVVRVEAHEIEDVAPESLCAAPTLEKPESLVALETAGETQRELRAQSACDTLPMSVPQFACARGTATAAVRPIAGATYFWVAEGATISSGDGTPVVTLTLGETGTVRLTALVTAPGCTTSAAGAIAIREPLAISELAVPPQAAAGQPVTVRWSYTGPAAPRTQLLRGDALEAPVKLDGATRSYTFTPKSGGKKSVELVASYAAQIASANPPASGGRRRAVGSTLVTATQCPSVASTARLEIEGCLLDSPHITAPGDVFGGEAFWASIDLAQGDSATWTATNATIRGSGTGREAEIVPDNGAGEVRVGVVVTRAADCSAASSVAVQVRPRIDCNTATPPTATVALSAIACRRATVTATFTGTPPFTGKWSDGTPFTTSSHTLTRDFTSAGAYTIRSFHDAHCTGTVSGDVSAEALAPSVTVRAVGGNCTNSKLVATFEGTPPFSGRWADGETFTTSSYTIERTRLALRTWWVTSLYDGLCSSGPFAESNMIDIVDPPRVLFNEPAYCATEPNAAAYVGVQLYDGTPPYTVHWSDGAVTTSSQFWMSRAVTPTAWSSQLSIVKVTTAGCDAVAPVASTTVHRRPTPYIRRDTVIACEGQTRTATLDYEMHPDAKLTWSIANGEIVSGQGTSAITFRIAATGDPQLQVQATYPDGACPMSDTMPLTRQGQGVISNLRMEPASIKSGGKSEVVFTRNSSVEHWGFEVSDPARSSDLRVIENACSGFECRVPYVDSKGAGEVTITIHYGGRCMQDASQSVKLTIAP